MEVIAKVISVPKEASEVVDFIAAMVANIKAKKSLAEIAAELPKLVAAVDGYNLLGEEMKAAWPAASAYLISEVGQALMVQAPTEVVPAV